MASTVVLKVALCAMCYAMISYASCAMCYAMISYASCAMCYALCGTATKNRNEASNGGGYAGSLLNVWANDANDELGIVLPHRFVTHGGILGAADRSSSWRASVTV